MLGGALRSSLRSQPTMGKRLCDVSQKPRRVEQARLPAIMKDGVAELVGRLLLNQNGRSLAAGSLSPC